MLNYRKNHLHFIFKSISIDYEDKIKQFLQYFDFTSFFYCTFFDFLLDFFRISDPLWILYSKNFVKSIVYTQTNKKFIFGKKLLILTLKIGKWFKQEVKSIRHDLASIIAEWTIQVVDLVWRIKTEVLKSQHGFCLSFSLVA